MPTEQIQSQREKAMKSYMWESTPTTSNVIHAQAYMVPHGPGEDPKNKAEVLSKVVKFKKRKWWYIKWHKGIHKVTCIGIQDCL